MKNIAGAVPSVSSFLAARVFISNVLACRNKTLKERTSKHTNRLQFVLTYNRTLPDAKKPITKNWNILHINQGFQQIFHELPITVSEGIEIDKVKYSSETRILHFRPSHRNLNQPAKFTLIE